MVLPQLREDIRCPPRHLALASAPIPYYWLDLVVVWLHPSPSPSLSCLCLVRPGSAALPELLPPPSDLPVYPLLEAPLYLLELLPPLVSALDEL